MTGNKKIYPCAKCGAMRSKNEGGEIFTVCDECWDKKSATNPKSRIWRDIDKHPLPERNCKIDVKLSCGSVLIGCSPHYGYIIFSGHLLSNTRITHWRDAE